MKRLIFSVLFIFAASAASAQVAASTFFTKADAFFSANVFSDGVKYDAIKANPAALNELMTIIGTYPLTTVTKGEAKAFLINAYNIVCIKNVVDHLPIAKPTDVPGFFDKITYKVAGEMLTLSDIENKKIRPVYKDARVHFVLVCAGKGCPPLASFAYKPTELDAQLTAQTKKALNDANWTKVDFNNKKVEYSQILDWYKVDFLAEAASLTEWVNKFRTTAIPTTFTVSFYTYNWALNIKK